MSQNPLQQFFRQPKVFIGLPSHGVYNKPGTFHGDIEHMPVYGMTGMDEIIIKTPDALLTGESVIKVIESCCPIIKDGWDLNNLDINVVLLAIRIATYGNVMAFTQNCKHCGTENTYEIDLSTIIDYYSTLQYNNKLTLTNLSVKTRPLTYKQTTEFYLKNFQVQQQLKQLDLIEDSDLRQSTINELFRFLGILQNELLTEGIETVDTTIQSVTEREYIKEWLENCDNDIIETIRTHIQKNQESWQIPKQKAICESCQAENELIIDLDQSNFFAKA